MAVLGLNNICALTIRWERVCVDEPNKGKLSALTIRTHFCHFGTIFVSNSDLLEAILPSFGTTRAIFKTTLCLTVVYKWFINDQMLIQSGFW